ncbi:glycosyltransferase family protein [Mucilaginibacter psychrotolerans]|uniref:Glycosyltransferase family 1 protein n=1 Tax=Mucilaginibacter psychrotolerans TaxID=1524096 RepID=A0A4Y8SQG6_9SPHI|nr:glycosyltransferase [Mucilaginibacter psychrotolerans]TFF40861.1 glycosyltransferase family 1 protein [Mucilaginibacter psychrotolerans]
MKILLSFLQDTGQQPHNIPAYRFWQHYIKNGIEEAGMQWLEVPDADWAEGLVHSQGSHELTSWSDEIWDKTLLYIKENRKKIGVFLCYLYPQQINEAVIAEIKRLGIPCINFYCDNVRHFTKVPREFKVFDWLWVPEYEALDMYRRAGINHIHLPMPMWVERTHREGVIHEHPNLVTFIGSKDVLRQNLLGEAISKGLDITVRGAGWLPEAKTQTVIQNSLSQKIANQFSFIQQHGLKGYAIRNLQQFNQPAAYAVDDTHIEAKPDHQEYIQFTQSSAVTLGINRVPTFKRFDTNPLTYSRLRDIEAPMLGACYLTEYCEGLDLLYEPEKEICTYRTADELVQQANRLLKDKARRDALRAAGQKRALAEHSIPASLQKLKAAIFK